MQTERETGSGRSAPARRHGLALRHSVRSTARLSRAAFTLVELLVVIAIIAILAGMLMPAIRGALVRAHESSTQNLIHQCEIAATGFFNDHGVYPPSTWQDFFLENPFKKTYVDTSVTPNKTYDVLDLNKDGRVDMADYNYFNANTTNIANTANLGNRMFLACLASKNGGPYLQPSESQLIAAPNTDMVTSGVYNTNAIQADIDWYMNSANMFELVDWWGNPLIYIPNRQYTTTDGVSAGSAPLPVVGPNGECLNAYSRYSNGFKTNTPPNLDSYQLYSLGADGFDNKNFTGSGTTADPYDMPPYVTQSAPPWTLKQMHFLANWEE